jgi:hypothetical protein
MEQLMELITNNPQALVFCLFISLALNIWLLLKLKTTKKNALLDISSQTVECQTCKQDAEAFDFFVINKKG